MVAPNEQRVLDAIAAHFAQHHRMPTHAELAETLGLKSKNSSWQYLQQLQRKGTSTLAVSLREVSFHGVSMDAWGIQSRRFRGIGQSPCFLSSAMRFATFRSDCICLWIRPR